MMILTCLQILNNALWEPLFGIFIGCLCILLLRLIFGDARRNFWPWLLVSAVIYAAGWRYFAHIRGSRYHNIFIFICLVSIIDLLSSISIPKICKQLLLIAIGRARSFHIIIESSGSCQPSD